MSENNQDEDIITIHLGRVVPDEVYDQIVKDIVRLLERKYPSDAFWIIPVAGFICGFVGAMTFDLLNRKKK